MSYKESVSLVNDVRINANWPGPELCWRHDEHSHNRSVSFHVPVSLPLTSLRSDAPTRLPDIHTIWLDRMLLGISGSFPGAVNISTPHETRILIATFQYGWNISVLNQIQAVITCPSDGIIGTYGGLPTCIPGLSAAVFSFVTAVFSAGGLGGSALASVIMDRLGRKQSMVISAACNGTGAALMTASSTVSALVLGRYG